MAAREAARWAWRALAVFRAATASTAAARPGDGASSLRRIFDVTESAASGGLRGCRPWVSVRRSPRDATKVDSGCGHVRARRSLASIRPAIGARGFASAAEAAPVPSAPPPLDAPSSGPIDAESSSPASGTPASSRKRGPKPGKRGRPRDRREVLEASSSSEPSRHEFVVSDADALDTSPDGSTSQMKNESREKHEKRLERQNARLHRRSLETARRLRSKKRQSLIGIQTWIAQNPDRLDRFTLHLACRLLAQHFSRANRRAKDEADGVFSLRGGNVKVRVEPTRKSVSSSSLFSGKTEEEETETNTADNTETEDIERVAFWVIFNSLRRVSGEATNAHEWSRLLDGVATLAKAGVTCGDAATIPHVDSFTVTDSFDNVDKRLKPRKKKEKERRNVTLSEAAVWHVTARGSSFASTGSPADVVNNLKALATIAESYPGSVCASGARSIASAAYARAVEWSDFEIKSALTALDRLVAFVKKEEPYVVGIANSIPEEEDDAFRGGFSSGAEFAKDEDEKPEFSKKKRKKKKKTSGPSPSPSEKDPSGSFVTRHAFAEGFDATRALVRAVAAARADGTLMSVARKRGGGNVNGHAASVDAGTPFGKRRRSKPKPKRKGNA